MKCVKCGAEMKEGCVYCSVCGNEAQILPDYSVLEDEYLRSLLQEENQPSRQNQTHSEKQTKENGRHRKKNGGGRPDSKNDRRPNGARKKKNRTPIILVCCLLVVSIITGIAVKISIDHKNANSYEYQVTMAEKEMTDKNYESALTYYKRALSIKPQDIPVRLALTEIYMERQEYDSAMVLLMEIINLDKKNADAYSKLISIYEEKEDYESIAELADDITDKDILKLFEEYLVTSPVIYPADGTYDDFITVTILSMDKNDIYYTTDGSKPDKKNGILYRGDSIKLEEEGEYEFQAVCINDKGISSDVVAGYFEIEFQAPAYPEISPDGGRVFEETLVTMKAESNCSIYYTWDGTDPTKNSEKYQGPLEIPTGNNILSVLAVDNKTGLDSGVYRTNFIYYP